MKKNRKALNRAAIAALSASMVAPSVAPAIPVFAEELEKMTAEDVEAANKATPSTPEIDQEDQEQSLPDEEIEDEVIDDEIMKDEVIDDETSNDDLDATPSVPQQEEYPEFGTSEFWDWFDELLMEICGEDVDRTNLSDTEQERLLEKIQAWHKTITEDVIDDDYPAFSSEADSAFMKWFMEFAASVDEDGNINGYDDDILLQWIKNSDAEDVMHFLLMYRTITESGITPFSALGDLWPATYGQNSNVFEDGTGTKEHPYIIDSVQDLRAVAVEIANPGSTRNEDTYYKIEAGTYDLQGCWIPIGFPSNDGGTSTAFRGHMAAEDGANIINLGIKANSQFGIDADLAEKISKQEAVGFFGVLGDGATVTGLNIDTKGNTLVGNNYVGILAGDVQRATIKECTVKGHVKGYGYVGGLVGYTHDDNTGSSNARTTIIEDCVADGVAAYTVEKVGSGEFLDGHACVGGIVGLAENTSVLDTSVKTYTGNGGHVYGNNAYVGGIAGAILDSDLYNSEVKQGEIGSSNDFAVGGILGAFGGGNVKVARFSGDANTPNSTNHYSAAFIGTRVRGGHFVYGEGANIGYLFTDSKEKADTGICGSRIEDDGVFDTDAHIGYWHANDIRFSLISGNNAEHSEDYFYKELENGIKVIRNDDEAQNIETINHYTANKSGHPTRGYMLTIETPMVDGKKAAEITAHIDGTHKPIVTADDLGAYAPGDVVYVSFKPLKDGNVYFQMDNEKEQNPYYTYYEKDLFDVFSEDTITEGLVNGNGFYFVMPESDVTLGAKYKSVSQGIEINPSRIVFDVVQERTGNRENPTITYKVTAYDGDPSQDANVNIITDINNKQWKDVLIMTVNDDGVETETKVPFPLGSKVNGVDNKKFNLQWAIQDEQNNIVKDLTVAGDVEAGRKASFLLDVSKDSDNAMMNYIKSEEERQKQGGYKDSLTSVAPKYFHSMISAKATIEDSEDKDNPPIGYTDITVRLHIKDGTSVAVKRASLDRNEITYDVVRTLTGDRTNPTVKYTVKGGDKGTTGASLTAAFEPDYFSNDQVHWYVSKDNGNLQSDRPVDVPADHDTVGDGTISVKQTGTGDHAYRNATINLDGITDTECTNATIKGWVDDQDLNYTDQMLQVPATEHSYTKYVKVTAEDKVNGNATDTCKVTVNFHTEDQTEIQPTAIEINDKGNIHNYNILYKFAGDNQSEITARTITKDDAATTKLENGIGDQVSATVSPVYDNTVHAPYKNGVVWSLGNHPDFPDLNVNDILHIDSKTGQITVRGYNNSAESADLGYSPWVQSLIRENKLDGTTVKVRVIAKTENGKLEDYKDISISFKAETMSPSTEDSVKFDVVLTKDVANSLADTDIQEKETWSGTDAQKISATSTGTAEAPVFTVEGNQDIIRLRDSLTKAITTNKYVMVNTDAQWIQNIIKNRKTGNTGSEQVVVKAKTNSGTSVTEIPVAVNFRYDGTDMTASTVSELPEGYEASPDVIVSSTPENTYDVNKAQVKDRQITMDVVATQGNYSVNNPGTRKWSYGIVKLDNTTYSSQGVKENDAVYELSGDIKDYCKVDANGYLVPIKGNWEDLISAGQTKGSVSGIVTAKKEADGKTTSDSYKVTINFRYDKAVLNSHEETFDVVYTHDSRTNSEKSHWSGDEYIQLKAQISDESGQNVTPVWESSDPSIVTVDQDGRVFVNKETWIKDIIDNAQAYDEDTHSGTKTVTVTAKHPTTGATADTCTFTVNFRYDKAIVDKNEEVYNLVLTQTSRTNNPSAKWSGNDLRKLNAKIFVAPGLNNNPYWASEDSGIVTVDEAGNIQPVIDADWQKEIIAQHRFSGQKKVAINVTNDAKTIKDSTNVTVNFNYENVEMDENAKTMDVVITASGNRSNPNYTVTGATTGNVSAVLNSANPDEKKVVYSSGDSNLLKVDQDGRLSLVLPMVKDANGNLVQAQGTEFSKNAHGFIQEALKHKFVDLDGQRYISSIGIVVTAASEDGRMADQCNVKLNIKYIDNTYSSSGGGGGGGGSHSGGGGGGGSSSSAVTPGGTTSTGPASSIPDYVVSGGKWVQNAEGKWLYTNNRTYTNEWAAVLNPYADPNKGQKPFDWFHFGADSFMTVGWYTDANNDTFFLHNVSDNTLGHMYTGWNWIDDNGDGFAECYYFQEQSDGRRGRLFKNEKTPDGYTVNEKGQWTENGQVITKDIRPQQ